MKRIDKFMSLMVAMMIVVGMVGVQRVEATSSFSIISVNSSKSTLEKGDSFGLFVGVSAGDGITFDYADFTATSSVDAGTATGNVLLAETAPDGEIYIGGLTFLGGDGNVNFTIYGKDSNGVEVSQGANIKLNVEIVSDGEGALQLKDTPQISLVAGETTKVDVLVYNKGTTTVKSPSISVAIAGDKTDGLTIKGGKAISVSTISSKSSARITFEIEASKAVKSGNYKLEFNLAGTRETVPLKIISDFMPPQLQFSIEEQQELTPGTPHDLRIKVKNVGDSEAKEIKIELENKEDMAIVGGSNVKYISKIAAKQSADVTYKVNISPAVKQNMLPIKITYTYKDEIGEPNQDKEQYIYIPVRFILYDI